MHEYCRLFQDAMPQLTAQQCEMFARLLAELIEANKTMNLTAVADPATAVQVHFADSVALLAALHSAGIDPQTVRTAADIGAGAGFPSLPCAVLMAQCAWYPVESTVKKSKFTRTVADKLKLTNVYSLAVRGEELGQTPTTPEQPGREGFELVTARALAAIPTLLEVLLPLAKIGGMVTLFKTSNTPHELKQFEEIVTMLGGEVLAPYEYSLPGDHAQRVILRIRKVAPTPAKYPRRNGVPFKKPLKSS